MAFKAKWPGKCKCGCGISFAPGVAITYYLGGTWINTHRPKKARATRRQLNLFTK